MTWQSEVESLYLRDEDMEVSEFDALMDVAIRGERPDDDRLPASLWASVLTAPVGFELPEPTISNSTFFVGVSSCLVMLLGTTCALLAVTHTL